MTTIMTAAQRRTILANAHAAFHATRSRHDVKSILTLANALKQTDMIASYDVITDVRLEGTTICIFVDCDDFREVLELDAYGNVLKGQE